MIMIVRLMVVLFVLVYYFNLLLQDAHDNADNDAEDEDEDFS